MIVKHLHQMLVLVHYLCKFLFSMQIFDKYHVLLNSENYVTRRQSLKVYCDSFSHSLYLFFSLPPSLPPLLSPSLPPSSSLSPSLPLAPSLPKLLGELLLDRHNYTVMTRYISNPENLKMIMNMLRDRSRNIQFEAFHVFKVREIIHNHFDAQDF